MSQNEDTQHIYTLLGSITSVLMVIIILHEKSKIPFSYMLNAYSVKEPIGELNLKRAFG